MKMDQRSHLIATSGHKRFAEVHGDFKDGRFAFYNQSQNEVTYAAGASPAP